MLVAHTDLLMSKLVLMGWIEKLKKIGQWLMVSQSSEVFLWLIRDSRRASVVDEWTAEPIEM